MSHFFIDRPIFAWVIALVIMLAGVLSITRLPIAQYPSIAPPTITINATYPGASAKTLEDTVTQIIEQRMTGLDGLRYIASTSDSAGTATITLTFDAAVNPDIAQVQVQNKLKLAESQLPQEVQQQGVTVTKSVRNFIMVIGFVSDDPSMTRTDIADYVAANVLDPLSRVPGVGELTLFGSQYAMRIWLDPNKLINYKLTPGDVAAAIRAQNAQIAAGQLGGLPAIPGQRLNATISAQGRLQTPAQFEAIVLRTGPSGATVRLRDVARVELGGENYNTVSFYNGNPSSGLAVRLATGANALSTADAVKAKVAELERFFPPGPEVGGRLRHNAVHPPVDRGSRQDADRGVRARVPGDVCLPAEPAGHADPGDRGPGRAARHVRRDAGVRLLDQRADDVRRRAGHWPAGRRCDRRRRKRRAPDERGGPLAERGHTQVDGPDHGRTGRHRAGPRCRVHPDGVLRRLHRRHLPPVLDHDGVLDGAFGRGGADPFTGALRHAAHAAGKGVARRHAGILRVVQSLLRTGQQPVSAHRRANAAFHWALARGLRRNDRARRIPAGAAANVVPPRRRSGDPVCPGHSSGRGDAGAHACGPARGGAALPAGRKGDGAGAVHGRRLLVFRQRPECRHRLRAAQGLEGATRRAQQRAGSLRPCDGGVFQAARRHGVRVRAAGRARARRRQRIRPVPAGPHRAPGTRR